MSTVSSRYPSFEDLRTADDVFADTSDPYAEVLAPGPGIPEPYPPRNGSCSGVQVCKSQQSKLQAANKQLRYWDKKLAKLLVSMVVFVMLTVIPLFVLLPQLKSVAIFNKVFGSATADARGSGNGEDCVNVTEHFQEDLFRQCRKSVANVCTLDVNTALCLMTKTKEDLNRRTQALDDEIYKHNKWIQSQVNENAHNISLVYRRRPSVHLYLMYSLDGSREANQRSGLLKWSDGTGLSPVRDMEVTTDDEGHIRGVKVTKRGYYYVYSHVTYNSPANGTDIRPAHWIFKNYGLTSESGRKRKKLLESFHVFNNTHHVSFLQGIFMLNHNDTLSVWADLNLISRRDIQRRKHTFFGAFRI